jgi:hypothetical protein
MKHLGKIYCITNLITKKNYIGQTIQSLNQRFREHKCNALTHLYKNSKLCVSMRKYGIQNFVIQLLEKNIPIEQLNEKEEHYIKFFNTVEKGYNIIYRERKIRSSYLYDVEDIIRMYKNKNTIKEIAQKYSSCRKTISSILKENGVEIRDWNKEQSVGLTKERLIELYVNQKLTTQRVGEVVGLSNVAVNNWLRKYGIERRLPHNWSSKMPLPTVM